MFDLLTDNQSQRALLDTLLMDAPAGLAFIDRAYRYVWANHALAANTGFSATEILGRSVAEAAPLLWPSLEPLYHRALAGEAIVGHELSGRVSVARPEWRHWMLSHYPVWQHGEVVGVGVFVNDIARRVQTEQALAVRNDLYAMLSRTNRAVSECHSKDALFAELCSIAVQVGRFRYAWIGVPDGAFLKVVAGAGEDHGYMEHLVISLDSDDPRSQGPTGRAARFGQPIVVNDFMAAPITAIWHERAKTAGFAASAAFPLFERGKVVAVLTLYAGASQFFTDDLVTTLGEITPSVSFALDALLHERERERAEAAARQSQKMEALGRLAGGVAHDFNNLLTVISGYSDLMMLELSAQDPRHELMAEIRKASEHATQLTRQLLAFSRQQQFALQPLELNTVVRDTANMLGRLIGSRIALHLSFASQAGVVRADPGQLTQVIVNLAVNARDAMPDGGDLFIDTTCVVLSEAEVRGMPELMPGRHAALRVRDTGVGMDEATRSRIFEPFFTTKSEGKGTGLGLATVHGIVTQLHGHIAVESTPGVGTTFTVLVPQLPAQPAPQVSELA